MEKPNQNTYVSIFQQSSSQKSLGESSIFSSLMKSGSSGSTSSSQKQNKKQKGQKLQELENKIFQNILLNKNVIEQETTIPKKICTNTEQSSNSNSEKTSIKQKQDSPNNKLQIINKIEVVDHTKPRNQSSTRVFQSLLSWLFTKQGINPLWIVIQEKHLIQNFVYITINVPRDFENYLLNKEEMPFLSQYYDKKNIAVFKERQVQKDENYWHQLFQTKSTEDISLPLFNKNIATSSPQLTQEEYKAMNYEQKLYHKYSQFCHSKQILKNNLYPTDQEDFSDFVCSSSSNVDFSTIIFENKILALDCEMVNYQYISSIKYMKIIYKNLKLNYVSTEHGLELARISLVNFEGEVLIDQLVKTPNRIVNYNTQYSGITEEMLRDVKVDLKQAQELLFEYVCKDTILVGHSLENDLIALQVIHNKVIDTSILFMTKNERKLKLRDLTQKFLNCKIQQGSHCPSEDAKSALNLAKLRIEILDKFDSSKIMSGNSQVILDLLDQIIKTHNTVLVIDETELLMRLLQYGVHYDEIKQNTNELKLDKIVKWVKKKKKENCILPRIIMTQLLKEKKQMSYKCLDSKLKEIVENSPLNSGKIFNL